MSDLFGTTNWADAVMSPCKKYRYELTRGWDSAKPVDCWIMLNPSTADAFADDSTIRRCINFSLAWGAGGIIVVNLFALRSTDPRALHADPAGAVGPWNDRVLLADGSDYVRNNVGHYIAAWGVHGSLAGRDRAVTKLLAGRRVECLGLTKSGKPRHPLYVPGAAKLVPFETSNRT
jgi:hypothetical protein